MTTRIAALLVVGVALFCVLLIGALWFGETLAADRDMALRVQPKMSENQVVDALGVMYDNSKRGEYKEVDTVISRMNDNEAITYVCCWRIAYSWDRCWVGFDDRKTVVATYLEAKSP